MIFYDADLVGKFLEKTLNMEFDWKRSPASVGFSNEYNHIAFSTVPWRSAEEFFKMREHLDEYKIDVLVKYENKKTGKIEEKKKRFRRCLKTIEDYKLLTEYIEGIGALDKEGKKYLHRKNGPIRRLRHSLAIARRLRVNGLLREETDKVFSEILVQCGIPCKVTDIENVRKKDSFMSNQVPRTTEVEEAMKKLKGHFPDLKVDEFLTSEHSNLLLPPYEEVSGDNSDSFIRRL
jgi:hypothetical protein